jgi:hypothetical protein
MWKTVVLAGMGFLLALNAQAADRNRDANHSLLPRPDGPFKKIVSVEMQGQLKKVVETIYIGPQLMKDKRFPMPTIDFITVTRWEITVNGKTYELELGTKELQALAEKLAGKTVLLEGRLETRWRRRRSPLGPEVPRATIAYPPVQVSVVVVNRLQNAEFIKETISVVVSGKLQMNARLGYPPFDSQAIITTGGKTYVLDFGNNAALRLVAQLRDGQNTTIKGTFTGFYSVHTMCVPSQTQLPIIRIDSVQPGRGEFFQQTVAVHIKGKLEVTSPWMGDRNHEDDPEFRIMVDGKTYGLEFDKQNLRNLASNLNGKRVVLTGTLELRRTLAGSVWQILVVQNLQADPGDFVRQNETIDFCCPLVPIR